MDISYIVNPVISSGVVAAVFGIALLLTIWRASQQIKAAALWIKTHIFNWTCFFWVVNLVCMAFSAQNAGYIFNLYEKSTGIFLGVALDMLIIAFTQAMLAAKARGERSRAAKILLFIVFCCLLSTAGNLAHNLHTDIANQTQGVWFQIAIPYLVSTMPLFLIALAWVADLKVNPIESMDIDQYKANEKKHLDFLQIQIDNREEQAKLDERMIVVESLERRNKQLRAGRAPRSFRWPWEPKIDIGYIISNVADNMKNYYEEKISESTNNYQQKIDEMQKLSLAKQSELEQHIQELLARVEQSILRENEAYRAGLVEQYDQDVSLLQGRINEALSEIQSGDTAVINTDEVPSVIPGNRSEKAEQTEEVIAFDEETKILVSRYPIVASWLSTGTRSLSLQDVIDGTKLSPQRVYRAARNGVFRGTRREGYYHINSIITWLKTVPLPKAKEANNNPITSALSDGSPQDNGHSNGHKKQTQPLANLVPLEI